MCAVRALLSGDLRLFEQDVVPVAGAKVSVGRDLAAQSDTSTVLLERKDAAPREPSITITGDRQDR